MDTKFFHKDRCWKHGHTGLAVKDESGARPFSIPWVASARYWRCQATLVLCSSDEDVHDTFLYHHVTGYNRARRSRSTHMTQCTYLSMHMHMHTYITYYVPYICSFPRTYVCMVLTKMWSPYLRYAYQYICHMVVINITKNRSLQPSCGSSCRCVFLPPSRYAARRLIGSGLCTGAGVDGNQGRKLCNSKNLLLEDEDVLLGWLVETVFTRPQKEEQESPTPRAGMQ
jgi:hypothetical protein